MSSTTLTLRLPHETKQQLEWLAQATGRSKAYLALDALQRYLEIEAWQIKAILDGVAEADAGNFATEQEVRDTVARLKGDYTRA